MGGYGSLQLNFIFFKYNFFILKKIIKNIRNNKNINTQV